MFSIHLSILHPCLEQILVLEIVQETIKDDKAGLAGIGFQPEIIDSGQMSCFLLYKEDSHS